MSDYFERVERQIVQRVEAGAAHSSRVRVTAGNVAVAAAVLVVIVVAGVFVLARGGGGANPAPAGAAGVRVVLTASPGTAPSLLARSAHILSERLHGVVPQAKVSSTDGQIVVSAANAPAGARSRILALAAPGRLAFYDWEADVVAPNGKTVASQLPSPDPSVVDISQGNGSSPPGQVGAGCLSLGQALALADKLGAGRRHRTESIGRLTFSVPIGYVVIEAASPHAGDSDVGFFVLRNRPALTEGEITNPQQSTDHNSGVPDVKFDFTPGGRRAFQAMTATVARRGATVSSLGNDLNQHFAIVLDNQVVTVPYIDFKQYPDGVSGDNGGEILGNLTKRSAQDLALLLRYGPLPLNLTAAG